MCNSIENYKEIVHKILISNQLIKNALKRNFIFWPSKKVKIDERLLDENKKALICGYTEYSQEEKMLFWYPPQNVKIYLLYAIDTLGFGYEYYLAIKKREYFYLMSKYIDSVIEMRILQPDESPLYFEDALYKIIHKYTKDSRVFKAA